MAETVKDLSTRLGFEVHVRAGHEQAVEKVNAALRSEGFGVLTRIDAHHTFKEKLGKDFRPYTILGACQPSLAFRALSQRPESGLLMPCNVTIEAAPGGESTVRIADPEAVLGLAEWSTDPELEAVAADARTRLLRVAAALGRTT